MAAASLVLVACFPPAAWSADRGPIASGENKVGVSLVAPSYMDTWTFEGTSGDRLLIDVTETSGSMDAYIELYPPGSATSEATTLYNYYGWYGANQMDHRLLATGTYTIVIRDVNVDQSGTYNLSLLSLPGAVDSPPDLDGGPIASGETRHGAINLPSDMDAFLFYGKAGDRLLVDIAETTAGMDAYVDIYPPAGGDREATTLYNYYGWSGANQVDHRLLATGVYTIVIRDVNVNESGSYNVSVLSLPGSVNAPADLDGGPIASGETRSGAIDVPSDMDAFQVYGNAGDVVLITVAETGGSSDAYIEIYPPGGGEKAATTLYNYYGWYGGNQLDHQFTATGLHTILIRDVNVDQAGFYNISLSKIPPAGRPGLYDPSPPSGSLVGLSGSFGWSAVAGAVCYDLYFGDDVTAPLQRIGTCLTQTTMSFPPLSAGKVYHWHVVAHTPAGDIEGPYWWFETGWCENFEAYAAGSFPYSGNWALTSDGENPANQFVGDARAVSGLKSLRLQGSGNIPATAFRGVGVPLRAKLAGKIYIDQSLVAGPTPLATFNLRNRSTGVTYGGVQFRRDGRLYAVRDNLTADYVDLGAFSTRRWYHVELYIDLCAMSFSVYVDGQLLGSGIEIIASDSPTGVLLAAGLDAPVWFDDVCVTPLGANEAPSFSKGADPPPVLEDGGAQTVSGWATNMSPGPPEDAWQSLDFMVTGNTRPALFAAGPAVNAASGDLTYTPAENANGCATVEIRLHDNGGSCGGGEDTGPPQTFEICVTPVNDAPSFARNAAPTVPEDAGSVTIEAWATDISAGPPDEVGQVLTFAVTGNSNPDLFAAGPALDAATGDLRFTPAPDANGGATITIELRDDGGTANGGTDTSPARTFVITVNPVNDAPSFTGGGDPSPVPEDSGAQTVFGWATNISAGPADESGQARTFLTTGNSNPALFAAGPAVNAATGDLTYTPALNANGSAVITLVLRDGGGTANGGADTSAPATFVIRVTAVNDAPTCILGPGPAVPEDSGAQRAPGWASCTPGPPDEAWQDRWVVVTGNSNPGLFAAGPAIDPATGDLTFTPATDANGSATITYEAHDDGGTANGGVDSSPALTFVIVVTPVNDAPGFTGGGDPPPVPEDSGAQTVAGWATNMGAGPSDESGQALSFVVTGNSDPGLFAAGPAVSASTGDLTFTPALNANGSATITLVQYDDGGTTNGGVDASSPETFVITVTAVNDPPVANDDSFTVAEGGTLTVAAPGVLENDTDVDSHPLTVREVTSLPANGTLTLNSDGSFTYVHDGSETTSDAFTYTATDGAQASNEAVVTITVTPVDDALLFSCGFTHGKPTGDPDWLELRGDWSVPADKWFHSSAAKTNLAVSRDRDLERFAAGRIEALVKMYWLRGAAPNASIVFALQKSADGYQYRYLRLTPAKIYLGDTRGTEVSRTLPLATGKSHKVRIDAYGDGLVRVFVDGKKQFAYKFPKSIAGKVGVGATRAKSGFDNFTVWKKTVLP